MLASWVFCLGASCDGVVAQWNNSAEWFSTHYDVGSWFFCLGDFCNGVVAQWNNSVEWFTTHYDALWDLGTTTVMSLGQALKLFAFWLCFFLRD
jgi:hypothetical protein